jgi:aspartate kinase
MSDVVIKIGGSILTGAAGYDTAANWLRDRLSASDDRFVVVVSAEFGQTDALYREAVAAAPDPDPALLDLLWSTGETRSVALLALRLRAAGERATGIAVHETGLGAAAGHAASAGTIRLNPLALRAALAAHRIVIVPGFLATRAGQVVTLGRGGSDWSAVLLAAQLGAGRCELIKDVDGYFTADPHTDAAASLIHSLDYMTALRMADAGCPLVQRHAIAEAAAARLPLVIRSLASRGSLVHA